jgi:16S rRNA processing protein RimM
MGDDSSALIQLGLVGAPFGVKGWIKLRSDTDPPERLLEHRRWRIGRGQSFRDFQVEDYGRSGGMLTAKLAGIQDRDGALALRGAEIWVLRSELPKAAGSDFYRADLIGCEVVTAEGETLGTVAHFIETPAHALMVVRGAKEAWIPAVPRHLRRIDLGARRVVVDWQALD